jgi:cation diffusion facilitator family transporter
MRTSRWPSAQRVAGLALAVTLVLAVAKVVVWVVTGSLAVLSQALDSLLDIVALGLVFVAVRIADKPADATHHYGHAKVENLVAFTQTLLLGALTIAIAAESTRRLLGDSPSAVETPPYAIALMVISVVVDGARVWMLSAAAGAEGRDALRAGALNLAGDVGTACVALVSLVLVDAGIGTADPVGALVVAAGVLFAAGRLGKRSVDVLMDTAPGGPVEAIEAATTAAAGVAETRRVRVRPGGAKLFADVTVAAGSTSSLERAHDIAVGVEREIERAVPGTDVVVHVEPAPHGGLVEQIQAAASRTDGVHEVHNVSVRRVEGEGSPKLHVTLHAKASPDVSLGEAHGLSDAIEASIVQELGDDVRVDTHIEPLEAPTPGHDVTDVHADIVSSVERLAAEEPVVLDSHEILVTSSEGKLSVVAHVRGPDDLLLWRMHEASTRIEKSVRALHPEVRDVLIHFEPAGDHERG